MSIVSHLHQFFSPETCPSYIHRLRWKERLLQCPRCQSHNVGPWGAYHYQPGLQRYRCKEQGCKRTFNDLTGTLLCFRPARVNLDFPWLTPTVSLGVTYAV